MGAPGGHQGHGARDDGGSTGDPDCWGPRTTGVLAATTVLAVAVGLTLSATEWGEQELTAWGDLRSLVVVVAGILLFGGGVMELAAARVDLAPHHLRRGTALAAFGLAVSALLGLGGLVHDSDVVAALNPATTSAAALSVLVFLALTTPRRPVDPFVHVPLVVIGSGVGVGALAALHLTTGFALDHDPAARLVTELVLAAGWLVTALHSHRSGASTAETALWAWLGVFWGMRAAAVGDATWGVASGLLLVAIALAVIAVATWGLITATDAEHDRVDEATAALVAAQEVVLRHEQQRRLIRHDARNAMLALRMSTYALARHGEHLDPQMRERLSATVVEQVDELEALLSARSEAQALAGRETT